ncbi:hypothetical protein B1992_00620 [Pseudoxanthomonas broegbernensis]|uniref:Uncharacterized protein n=1 Tax=Pseudoxanthomonas broegbernensis TaxID=83619 RepID=A0A7V8GQ61_9GAMM|nr:hypothetical protein B1992_00620 [Pseudoxanthomonas broegbernensis]
MPLDYTGKYVLRRSVDSDTNYYQAYEIADQAEDLDGIEYVGTAPIPISKGDYEAIVVAGTKRRVELPNNNSYVMWVYLLEAR